MHHVLLRLAATDGRQVVPQGQQQRYRRIKLALYVTMSFHVTHRHTCHASQSTVGRERSTRGEHGRDIYRKKKKKKKRAKMLASVRNNTTFAAYNYGGWRGLSRCGHTLQYSVRYVRSKRPRRTGLQSTTRRTDRRMRLPATGVPSTRCACGSSEGTLWRCTWNARRCSKSCGPAQLTPR